MSHSKPLPVPSGLIENPHAFLRRGHLLTLCSISDETLTNRIRTGVFPPPDAFDGPIPLWLTTSYRNWQAGFVARSVAARAVEIARKLENCPPHRRAELQREARLLHIQAQRIDRAIATGEPIRLHCDESLRRGHGERTVNKGA